MLEDYSKHIEKIAPVKIGDILAAFAEDGATEASFRDKQTVTVCGMITRRQIKTTKNGASMAFLDLEDRFGEMEVIVFPKTFEECVSLLKNEAALAITGQLSLRDDEDPKLLCQSVVPLSDNAHFDDTAASVRTPAPKPAPAPVPPPPSTGGVYHVSGRAPMNIPQAREVPPPMPQTISKVYLRVDRADETDAKFKKAENLVQIFCDGFAEVIFYDKEKAEYRRMTGIRLAASPFVSRELREVLGEENVVVK